MLKKISLWIVSLFSAASFAQTAPDNILSAYNPISGNPHGSITVAEFFDYQCSHCAAMVPVITAIIKANPALRVVFKDLPIRGPESEFAARAGLAANKQGKYISFMHALFALDQPLTEENILATAKSVGLNTKQLQHDMYSKQVTSQLKANYRLAQSFHLEGTPAFLFGKTNGQGTVETALGEMSQSDMQAIIDKIAN